MTAEVLDSFDVLPDPNLHQIIVRLVAPRGNNLHLVEHPDNDDTFLVSMPKKFRKSVWIKRGDFVIVEPIKEGDKVKAEIVSVLYKEQIKFIKKEGLWPKKFDSQEVEENKLENLNLDEESNSSDEDLFKNTNRPVVEITESSSEEEQEEEQEEVESQVK